MKPIFLIGFMGCGKTTLGRAVAAASPLTFIDLDELIESRQGMSVGEIFSKFGQDEFRRLESEALISVASTPDAVIATGGGTPLNPANMELMNGKGITVFLDTSTERLLDRLSVARASRPLLAELDDAALEVFVKRTLETRRAVYEQAKVTFSGDLLDTADEIDLTVGRFLESFHIQSL